MTILIGLLSGLAVFVIIEATRNKIRHKKNMDKIHRLEKMIESLQEDIIIEGEITQKQLDELRKNE